MESFHTRNGDISDKINSSEPQPSTSREVTEYGKSSCGEQHVKNTKPRQAGQGETSGYSGNQVSKHGSPEPSTSRQFDTFQSAYSNKQSDEAEMGSHSHSEGEEAESSTSSTGQPERASSGESEDGSRSCNMVAAGLAGRTNYTDIVDRLVKNIDSLLAMLEKS